MEKATQKKRYLDAVVEAMIEMGRTDLSLTAMADAAGTSDRMLVYYFKKRDALLSEAAIKVADRRRRRIATMVDAIATARTPADGLHQVFGWVTSPDNAADIRLFYGTVGGDFRDEPAFDGFLQRSIRDWVDEGAAVATRLGADAPAARAFGTLLGGLAVALAADRLSTADDERIDLAIDAAVDALTRLLPAGALQGQNLSDQLRSQQ